MNTPAAVCRRRNRERDRPVPAPVITEQLRRTRRLVDEAPEEGWQQVVVVEQPDTTVQRRPAVTLPSPLTPAAAPDQR